MQVNSICIFCGSSPGTRPEYAAAARQLGTLFAEQGIGLVYGGASVGLMGEVANAALSAGGRVVGVIPRALWEREIAHTGLAELHVVGSMHERKATMAALADAFVALPGGIGTLEELFEIWTWGQLGLHHKPIGMLDVVGFFRPLVEMLDHMVRQGFVRPAYREMVRIGSDPGELLAQLRAYRPLPTPPQIAPEES